MVNGDKSVLHYRCSNCSTRFKLPVQPDMPYQTYGDDTPDGARQRLARFEAQIEFLWRTGQITELHIGAYARWHAREVERIHAMEDS